MPRTLLELHVGLSTYGCPAVKKASAMLFKKADFRSADTSHSASQLSTPDLDI